jgi:branched-chain amino acid transport system substrate-binding protein
MKHVMKRMGLVLTSALTLGACASVTTASSLATTDTADTVNIGGLWALSGSTASYGVVQDNAVKLAIDQRNAAGGIDGKEVTYTNYDDKGTGEESAAGTTYLAENGASVIIGPATAAETFAAQPQAENMKVPMVSPSITTDGAEINDTTGEVWEWFFKTCYAVTDQGTSLAQFTDDQGYETVALLTDNSTDHGQNLSQVFSENVQADIVIDESYVSGDTDFKSILANVQAEDPDAIFIAGYYQEAGPIIKQAREMGIDAPIIGGTGIGNQALVDLAGAEDVTDVYYSAMYVYSEDADQDVKDFVEAYREAYGTEPDQFSALAYDAANLVMDAIDRADSNDPDAIRAAIAETTDFDGICYDYTMNEDHTVDAPAFIQELQNGKPTDTAIMISPEGEVSEVK